MIIILVRKDIGRGVWSKSIKPEGMWLRQTQNCLPRPGTRIWSEINRCIVPQILIRYNKDKLKDILLFTVDSKQLDFICPNDSAGQNYKSVLIKVYIYSRMTNPQWIRQKTKWFGRTAYHFRVDVLESKIIHILCIKESNILFFLIRILISNHWLLSTT